MVELVGNIFMKIMTLCALRLTIGANGSWVDVDDTAFPALSIFVVSVAAQGRVVGFSFGLSGRLHLSCC
jgi:hypothetical protein